MTGLIVVQRRAEFKAVYEGGQQNFKNWRDFIVAVEVQGGEKEAWEEFGNIGRFNNFSGRKMSARFYTREQFDIFISKGRIKTSKVSPEQASVIRIVDALTKSRAGRLSDEEVELRAAAFDFILSACQNKGRLGTAEVSAAERAGLL